MITFNRAQFVGKTIKSISVDEKDGDYCIIYFTDGSHCVFYQTGTWYNGKTYSVIKYSYRVKPELEETARKNNICLDDGGDLSIDGHYYGWYDSETEATDWLKYNLSYTDNDDLLDIFELVTKTDNAEDKFDPSERENQFAIDNTEGCSDDKDTGNEPF